MSPKTQDISPTGSRPRPTPPAPRSSEPRPPESESVQVHRSPLSRLLRRP